MVLGRECILEDEEEGLTLKSLRPLRRFKKSLEQHY